MWRGAAADNSRNVLGAVVAVVALVMALWLRRAPKFSLQGRVVVITGGAHGIGKRLAAVLLQSVASVSVALVDIDERTLAQTRRELLSCARTDSTVRIFKCDVSDQTAVQACVAEISAAVAPKAISVLVNNAGIVHGHSVDELTPSQIRRTMEVNTMGQMWMIKAILPLLKQQAEQDSMIVTLASVMGLISGANLAGYCASKAAVAAFHDCLRLELWRDGFSKIRTVLVCPNAVDTGMFSGIMQGGDWTSWLSRLLLPASSESDAAQRIFDAMVHQEKLVVSCYTGWRGLVVPWLPAVARLLPVQWYDWVVFLGGGVHGMDTFVGRKHKQQ